MSSPAERYAGARRRAAAERTELARFRAGLPFDLDDFQDEACHALESGRGVLVAAPTGAGKTVVGEFAVHLALAAGRKAFYTTPIKALSNQKYIELARHHGAEQVGLLTGDTTVNGDAPVVVMTTEVLRNMLYTGSAALDDLAYVVMDEVHYLADRFRGSVWEEVIIHLPREVLIVSLSATVSNAEEFGDWLDLVRGDTAVVVSEHRPVPLWQHVLVDEGLLDLYAVPADGAVDRTPINPELLALRRRAERGGPQGRPVAGRRNPGAGERRQGRLSRGSRPFPRFAVVDVLDREALLPAIFFVFSRAGCEAAVTQCMAAGLRLTTPEEAGRIRAIVERRSAAIPGEDLQVLGFWQWSEALARGIAAHHAGVIPLFKETVEELFSLGLVKVVFATETLALGINMPARSVVLEKLVKWDGSAHTEITAGEYTQLTGRAGRRGIDVEGHAIVLDHPGLDPEALAGLAAKRTYPLRSSFRPTYNMAVNLVAQVGRQRAREILETSFAQFQADRGVVGLARQATAHAEALDGYARSMQCHLGDFAEYAELRRRIAEREATLSREHTTAQRLAARRSMDGLRVGDVLEIPSGRRAGYAVVLDPGVDTGLDGPRPTVLTAERQVKRLSAAELPSGVQVVAAVRVPRQFNVRNAAARRDLASAMRSALADPDKRRDTGQGAKRRKPAADDATLAGLRRQLRAHPCHGCSEREDHARWAERWNRLRREHEALLRTIEGRTGSIARVFDRICEVLTELGYLADGPGSTGRDDDGAAGRGRTRVTAAGQWLRRLYVEQDLLLAECLRRGLWDRLDAPALAAITSTVLYEQRREDQGTPRVPGGPRGALAVAMDATVRVWSELDDLQVAHGLPAVRTVEPGLIEAVHGWASGRSLEAVLRGTDLAAGDFVRWCKQVIDLLDQISVAAPSPAVRRTAERAVGLLRRGVVAYSSL